MSTNELLELELSLLLIKYEERKVFASLAKLSGLTITELETKLRKIQQAEKKRPTTKSKPSSRVIDEVINQHPQKSDVLRVLYARFQNKTFLSQLRDIKRLFNRHSLEAESIRSRSTAASKVFKLLASLDVHELEELAQEQDKSSYSSLGIISDEIMKHRA